MLEILGVPFSAHTRKVLLTLREKGLRYELTPIIPLNPPPGWQDLSPLGKIPVLRSPQLTRNEQIDSLVVEMLFPVEPQQQG